VYDGREWSDCSVGDGYSDRGVQWERNIVGEEEWERARGRVGEG